MLAYITLLLACQLAGEIIVRLLTLPVPGPVLGMLFLFTGLMIRGRVPAELDSVASGLLRYLSMLFVPAGVGVIVYLPMIAEQIAPIAGAVFVATLLSLVLTGWLMQRLIRKNRT